jgi:hypothetical protein
VGLETINLTPEDREAILAELYADPVLFCREILPHWFPNKMPWVHRGLMALALERSDFLLNFGPEEWEQETGEWTVEELRTLEENFVSEAGQKLFDVTWLDGVPVKIDIVVSDNMISVLPRGFSKTTLFKAILLLTVLYVLSTFIVYLSETGPHAEAQVRDIRREIQANEKIQFFFGNLVPDRGAPQKWSDEEFETLTGVHMVCRGRGGQVRGLNRGGTRPGRILFDDLEDLESVATEHQRDKARVWFRSDVERAGRLVGEPTKIFGIGTILHHEALIPMLMRDPKYLVVKFGALDRAGKPLWELAMDETKLASEKERYAATGDLESFHREVMSSIVPDELRKFRKDMWQYVPRNKDEFAVRALAFDPAISKKDKASKSAFAVTGMDDKGRIHVLDIYARVGMTPREQIDKFFELKTEWDTHFNGVEAIQYQQALVHIFYEEMYRKATEGRLGDAAFFEITEIRHNSEIAKETRILSVLQPRYKSGYITHQRQFTSYETNLQDWPNCKMDEPDAVAMSIVLLQPFAGLAGGETLNNENYIPALEREIGGGFRHAP